MQTCSTMARCSWPSRITHEYRHGIQAAISHRFGVCPRAFRARDNAAILVRNRETGKTIQRIAKAETIASPEFQAWLAARSAAGSDVYRKHESD